MKLKSILICLFIGCGLALQAQNRISVANFRFVENDITARIHGTSMEDQNGNICALIKVETTEKGIWAFDVGMLGVTKTELQNMAHPAEIWVYVPFGVTWISIQHELLGKLDHYEFPCSIEKGCTYIMQLTIEKVETIVKQEVTQQYLAFQISPTNAVLEVEGELWEVASDGSAMKFVNFGTYNYRVQAPNYHPEIGKVTVNDTEKTQKVTVTLKPDFVEVTLKVDADAEIWVNNEKKGTCTWTGSLGKGNYKIECKQAGHETSMIAKEITADLNGQTINLPKPTPLYGSLNIESTPNFATIYIDGEMVGETPKFLKEILTGRHELRLTKEGCTDYTETITIAKGERKQLKAVLDSDGTVPPSVKPQQPKPEQPSSDAFFVMANAAFSIAPQTSFGITVGSVKRFGWYVNLGTNFNFIKAKYECGTDGQISSAFIGEYQFSGNQKTSRLSATAGVVFRISDPIYAYLGGGYGQRSLLWEYYDSDNSYGWAKNTDYSYQGITFDAGLMLHFRGFGFSVGVQTIGFDYMEVKIGVGYTMKR